MSDSAVQVAGVEQGDSKSRTGGGGNECLSHCVRVGIGNTSGVVMQVVEFTDRGEPGEQHFAVDRTCELVVGVGVERFGGLVHGVAPRPKRAGSAVGPPSQRAVKGVTMGVGKPR